MPLLSTVSSPLSWYAPRDPFAHAHCRRSLGRSPIGEIAIVDTKFGTHLIKINERNDKFDPKKTKTDGGWSF